MIDTDKLNQEETALAIIGVLFVTSIIMLGLVFIFGESPQDRYKKFKTGVHAIVVFAIGMQFSTIRNAMFMFLFFGFFITMFEISTRYIHLYILVTYVVLVTCSYLIIMSVMYWYLAVIIATLLKRVFADSVKSIYHIVLFVMMSGFYQLPPHLRGRSLFYLVIHLCICISHIAITFIILMYPLWLWRYYLLAGYYMPYECIRMASIMLKANDALMRSCMRIVVAFVDRYGGMHLQGEWTGTDDMEGKKNEGKRHYDQRQKRRDRKEAQNHLNQGQGGNTKQAAAPLPRPEDKIVADAYNLKNAPEQKHKKTRLEIEAENLAELKSIDYRIKPTRVYFKSDKFLFWYKCYSAVKSFYSLISPYYSIPIKSRLNSITDCDLKQVGLNFWTDVVWLHGFLQPIVTPVYVILTNSVLANENTEFHHDLKMRDYWTKDVFYPDGQSQHLNACGYTCYADVEYSEYLFFLLMRNKSSNKFGDNLPNTFWHFLQDYVEVAGLKVVWATCIKAANVCDFKGVDFGKKLTGGVDSPFIER
jgi:hypothetical protein